MKKRKRPISDDPEDEILEGFFASACTRGFIRERLKDCIELYSESPEKHPGMLQQYQEMLARLGSPKAVDPPIVGKLTAPSFLLPASELKACPKPSQSEKPKAKPKAKTRRDDGPGLFRGQ